QGFSVGVEDAHGTMAGDDAHGTGGHLGEVVRRRCDEVALRVLGEPRGTDDLDAGDGLERFAVSEHMDMVGHAGDECRGVIDRRGIQRTVVAREQNDGNGEGGEDLEGAGDERPVELVGIEDVPAPEDEVAAILTGRFGDAGDGIESGTVEPRAGLLAEVVRGHAQLPVPRGDESHLLLLMTFPSYGRVPPYTPAPTSVAHIRRHAASATLTWANTIHERAHRPIAPATTSQVRDCEDVIRLG